MTTDTSKQIDSKKKRITVLNVWGTNRGDEAMQRALIAGLQDAHPDLDIAVFAKSQVDLPRGIQRYTWNDLPQFQIPLTPSHLLRFLRRVRDRSSSTVRRRAEARDFLYSSNLVVSGPAGPYIGDCYPQYEATCLSNIQFAHKHNIPCVITATSAGPFGNVAKNVKRRQILRKVKWWTIREPLSYDAVSGLAVPGLQCELVADLVFSRQVTVYESFQSNYERQDAESLLRFTSLPTIGVTLNTTEYIDNSAQHHYFDLTRYTLDMVYFLRKVVQHTGAQLLFFPHHYGVLREMELIMNIASAIGTDTPVRIVPPYLNSDCQQALISRLTTHISHRYHPTIFALQEAVPVFCIIHQFKTQGLLQQFKYPIEMPNTLTPIESWFPIFEQLWVRRVEIRTHIENSLTLVRQRSRRTIERLSETIQSL